MSRTGQLPQQEGGNLLIIHQEEERGEDGKGEGQQKSGKMTGEIRPLAQGCSGKSGDAVSGQLGQPAIQLVHLLGSGREEALEPAHALIPQACDPRMDVFGE